jgi:plasmid stabilization system protein ParE
MRLQLTVLAASVIVSAAGAMARAQPVEEPGAEANLRVYTDDDHVTVVSPSASVRAATSASTLIAVDMTVDAVSAASVDVVTSASPLTFNETRVELGVTGTYRAADTSWLTAGGRVSHENDYDAVRARIDARRELAQRNTSVQLGYVLGHDIARSASDAMFRATRRSHELAVVASQLLSERGVVDMVVHGTLADGYHASPYREVLVEQAGWPLAMRVTEQTPQRRASLASALRVRHALVRGWASTATYRYYADDWSISSHTASGELLRQSNRVLASLQLRGYVQSAATFYRARYEDSDGIPALRTRDRTLGAMRSLHGALTIDATLDDERRWHAVASVGVLRLWFLDFPAQRDRNAVIIHAGVATSW